jgi:hypothetical protein
MKLPSLLTMLVVLGGCAASSVAVADPPHGAVRDADTSFEAYDADSSRWLTPEAFWDAHAERGRGRYWGRSTTYPPYASVAEFDTFLVELESGDTCLMEFFHQRWRRANDVRRWNDRFNTYGACARVFD